MLIRQRFCTQIRPIAVLNAPRIDAGLAERIIACSQPVIFEQREARLTIKNTATIQQRNAGIVYVCCGPRHQDTLPSRTSYDE